MAFFRSTIVATLVLLGAASGPASAHPHMFVDAQAAILPAGPGEMAGIRVFLVVDPENTAIVLFDHGITTIEDEAISDEVRRKIGENMIFGLATYGYFVDFRIDGRRWVEWDVEVSMVRIGEGKLLASLDLTFDRPRQVAGREIEVALYDPSYYAAVSTIASPKTPDSLGACEVELIRFDPASVDQALLSELAELEVDEAPSNPTIGEQFADRSTIRCAPPAAG